MGTTVGGPPASTETRRHPIDLRPMSNQPTGEQYTISHGRHAAVVTEVGATLRSLTVDGEEWLWTFGKDGTPSASQGRQLLPWPNRIRDGKYCFGGVEYQLPITEVPRHVALHGLDEDAAWELVHHGDSKVVQRHTFRPQAGWPGTLTVTLHHTITDEGLTVIAQVDNDGDSAAPYGYGVHPYFAFDDVNEVSLELPFSSELKVDEDRLLPLEVAPVSTDRDFRDGHPLGTTAFDTAFTHPATPRWTARLVGPQHTVEVWGDETMPWVQLYTRPERDAIALEPMTCGPDAFNDGPTHDGLIVLAPGDMHVATWGVRAG